MKAPLVLLFVLLSALAYSQDKLDIEKHADCEVFKEKETYDAKQRIAEIESLEDQQVTVYVLKGKDNKIKETYSGTLKYVWKEGANLPDRTKASVVAVEVDLGDGNKTTNLPMTGDKAIRIYKKECLVQ